MYQSKLIAMIDKDEFIVLQGGKTSIDTLISESWFQEQKEHVCSLQLKNYRFYTHGTGDSLEMSSEMRNTLFPENWRQILQPIAKKETIDFVKEYDIKSLKSYVKSTYFDHRMKIIYIPPQAEAADIHYPSRCITKNMMFPVNTTTAVIHHYRKNFRSPDHKFFHGGLIEWLMVLVRIRHLGNAFPHGPRTIWHDFYRQWTEGKQEVKEVNDTTMVRFADELAMRVHRTHQAVKLSSSGK